MVETSAPLQQQTKTHRTQRDVFSSVSSLGLDSTSRTERRMGEKLKLYSKRRASVVMPQNCQCSTATAIVKKLGCLGADNAAANNANSGLSASTCIWSLMPREASPMIGAGDAPARPRSISLVPQRTANHPISLSLCLRASERAPAGTLARSFLGIRLRRLLPIPG